MVWFVIEISERLTFTAAVDWRPAPLEGLRELEVTGTTGAVGRHDLAVDRFDLAVDRLDLAVDQHDFALACMIPLNLRFLLCMIPLKLHFLLCMIPLKLHFLLCMHRSTCKIHYVCPSQLANSTMPHAMHDRPPQLGNGSDQIARLFA
ncbi:hypothetical protein ENSA7_42630 [Enhygromyxa salina]|uniref:Uncharacterized protein n=1 Tax=Enhygromyxa salina TaxID=215803 RepID=A0A2S9YLL5_9BACT|nr:hypothetical protein ENSA7_42630 [Enhygromyxa salina]